MKTFLRIVLVWCMLTFAISSIAYTQDSVVYLTQPPQAGNQQTSDIEVYLSEPVDRCQMIRQLPYGVYCECVVYHNAEWVYAYVPQRFCQPRLGWALIGGIWFSTARPIFYYRNPIPYLPGQLIPRPIPGRGRGFPIGRGGFPVGRGSPPARGPISPPLRPREPPVRPVPPPASHPTTPPAPIHHEFSGGNDGATVAGEPGTLSLLTLGLISVAGTAKLIK